MGLLIAPPVGWGEQGDPVDGTSCPKLIYGIAYLMHNSIWITSGVYEVHSILQFVKHSPCKMMMFFYTLELYHV
jgi:hypothetical protein